jgi:nucleoid DNA-binding protein
MSDLDARPATRTADARTAPRTAPRTATRADLAAAVHERLQLNKRDAALAVDAVVDAMTKAVLEGRPVRLEGLGKLLPRRQAARPGRNMQTGEPCEVPARTTVAFRPSSTLLKALKERP